MQESPAQNVTTIDIAAVRQIKHFFRYVEHS